MKKVRSYARRTGKTTRSAYNNIGYNTYSGHFSHLQQANLSEVLSIPAATTGLTTPPFPISLLVRKSTNLSVFGRGANDETPTVISLR